MADSDDDFELPNPSYTPISSQIDKPKFVPPVNTKPRHSTEKKPYFEIPQNKFLNIKVVPNLICLI